MLSENATVFTSSKVLFAMSIEEKGQKEMEDAIAALSKKEGDFYDTCAAAIRDMDEAAFASAMREFYDSYAMCSIEYKIPELSSVEIPLDSRLMKILPSENIKAPYVLIVSDPFKKREMFTIPLNTSKHSRHKIHSRKADGRGSLPVRPEGEGPDRMGLHAEGRTAKDGRDQRRGCRGHRCLICLQRGTVWLHAAGPGLL